MNDLAELFARDPLHLQDADLDVVINYYREKRDTFLSGPAKAAKRVKDPKAKIDLEELEIEL